MNEEKLFISLNLNKWSDFEMSDLFSRLHVSLNKVGKSVGFLMVYSSINDALDDKQNIQDLVEFTSTKIDKSEF